MNLEKLKQAENYFLSEYPGGFEHPEMQLLSKKHAPEKMNRMAAEAFSRNNFDNPHFIVESMKRIVNASSMVSLFEKPKFRDFAADLNDQGIEELADGLYDFLYGNQQNGFEKCLKVLKSGKMAKWSIITVCPVYLFPQKEVFVKPTTAKNITSFFEVENLVYKPQPSFEFYSSFRDLINEMKSAVDSSLSPSNPAFTGFLMMSMDALCREHQN